MTAGTLAKVSTLLMTVGLPHRPLSRGIGRPHARLAALAFDRMDQRRLLAADESPGAQADFEVELEARAEDVLAQQALRAALVDRMLDPLDRHRILGADVEEPCRAPMAYPAMIMPSITFSGSHSSMLRSMKAPGSPSSALQMR